MANEFAPCNDTVDVLFDHHWLGWDIPAKRWSIWGCLIGLAIILCGADTFILRLFINWNDIEWIATLFKWPCRTYTFIIQSIKSAWSIILLQIQYSGTLLYRESGSQIVLLWETFKNLILLVFSHSILRSIGFLLFLNWRNYHFCLSWVPFLILTGNFWCYLHLLLTNLHPCIMRGVFTFR